MTRLLARIALALLVLAPLAVLGVKELGERRLGRALERVRRTGAPVALEDVPAPVPDGRDRAAWMQAVEGLAEPPRFDADPLWEEAFREELAAAVDPERRRALEAVLPCIEEVGWRELHDAVEAKLRLEAGHGFELTACERAWLRAQARGWDAWRAAVAEPERLALPSFPSALALAPDEPHRIGACIRAATGALQAHGTAALDAALDGRPHEAAEAMADGLRVAAWSAELPHFWAYDLRLFHLSISTDLLRKLLPRLPSGVEVEGARAALEGFDARAELRRWIDVERAFGTSAYRQYREDLPGGLGGFWERARLSYDQLRFLEHYDRAARWAELPYHAVRADVLAWTSEGRDTPPWWAPLYAMLASYVPPKLEAAAEAEAQVLVTRGVLLARERGVEHAARWAAEQVDPFDGAPLRSRVRDDGVLELWSVGPNALDEGGRSSGSRYEPPDDVTARWAPQG